MNKFTYRSRGFGFVEMSDDNAGRKAIGRSEKNFSNSKSFNQTRY